MAYNDDQNEYPLPAGKNEKRTSVEHLPRCRFCSSFAGERERSGKAAGRCKLQENH